MNRALGRALALSLALAPCVVAAEAAAQSVNRREAGVVGGGEAMDTSEVDRCRPTEGLSNDEIDARVGEHYDRAWQIYLQGDYEAAIAEWVAAYCEGHHASLLHDIGQAFERLGRYEKAVAYFDRFLAEESDVNDAKRTTVAFRVEVIRNQPSRITVATVPPGAQIALVGPTGVVARATANADELIARRGRYELRVEQPGYEPIVEPIEVSIGRPYSYYFRLEPQTSRVRVFASPARARIFIDDRLVGVGSHEDALAVGTHKVTVEAPGREPRTQIFEVVAERPLDLRVALPARPRSGRLELVSGSTVAGGVFGAVAFRTLFGEGTAGATFGSVFGLGVGFGGAWLGVPDDVPVGTSSYLIGATVIGAAEGWLVAAWLCDVESSACGDDTRNAAAVFSGVSGLAVAAWSARDLDLSAGDAALVSSGAMWGTTAGALLWQVFGEDDRLGEPLTILGLNLGIAAGITVATQVDYSRAHVALIDLGGLAGLIAGAGLGAAIEPDDADRQRLANFALGGMGLGLVASAYLTTDRDDPPAPPRATPAVGAAQDDAGAKISTFGLAGWF